MKKYLIKQEGFKTIIFEVSTVLSTKDVLVTLEEQIDTAMDADHAKRKIQALLDAAKKT